MPVNIGQLVAEHFLTLPLGGDRFLISLSGVGLLDFTGQQGSDWHRDTAGMYVSLANALNRTGRTPSSGNVLAFVLEQWTPLITPNAFTDNNQAENFGVAVDSFQIDWQGGEPKDFVQVYFDVAARDFDTYLHRISYSLLLVGNVVEVPANPIP